MKRFSFSFCNSVSAVCLSLVVGSLILFAGDRDDFDARERLVSLNGKWRFSVGDDVDWAESGFNDREWSLLDPRHSWERGGYDHYNGYAWYRRSFRFSEDVDQPTYLVLGQIDDVDEVYVNGRMIGGTGQFPPNYVSAWNQDRIYALPSGILNRGKDNVVAVRVYDGGGEGGIEGRSLGIYTANIPLPEIDLTGEWKFHPGDNPEWKNRNADESDFRQMYVPSYWESAGGGNLDGFAWYRKTFHANPHAKGETMVLMLGKIDDTDEVFLNGTKIGSTGDLNDSDRDSGVGYYAQNRGYYFPASLLEKENVVAVRVHDHGGRGGIYEGPIGIISQGDYIDYWEAIRRSRGIFHSNFSFLERLLDRW